MLSREERRRARERFSKAHASGYPLEGRMEFQGLKISVEQRAGSTRSGVDEDGKPWSTTMRYPYGYIRMSEGVDGDHVDCYVGPHEHAERAYVIDQVNPKTGAFDEQKVMLGFEDAASAKSAYLAHYNAPRFFGSMRAMPMDEFKIKVLDKASWGKLVKAAPAGRPLGALAADLARARALYANLTGDLIETLYTDWRIREALVQLHEGHLASADGLAPYVRDYRGSVLEDAYLEHQAEANRAARVLGVLRPNGARKKKKRKKR